MMTIKNSQLDSKTLEILNKMLEQEIKASAAFKLSRILKDLSSIIEDKSIQERRILDKYTEKDSEGNIVQPLDDNNEPVPNSVKITDMELFNKEMGELMEVENEIQHNRISFDDLGLETATIKDLIKIDFLFE